MSLTDALKNQFRSIIQWDDPKPWEIFRRFTDRGDELKNVSKLILQPGQGALFSHEGKIVAICDQEGSHDIKTDNIPFITTFRNFMNAFESPHKAALWFYRKADIVTIRWGTRLPITYVDPVYQFPVDLCGFGNYSIRISRPETFFTNIVAGQESYVAADLQQLFLARIAQPIAAYLAAAKFSYAEVSAHIEEIAAEAKQRTQPIFEDLGFTLLDFRIEGTSFTDETNARIAGISDTQAEVTAAKIAGVDFAELQRLKAMRDAANNQGTGGIGMSVNLLAGLNPSQSAAAPSDVKSRLKSLKDLFDQGLIDEAEFKAKRQEILAQL